MGKSTQRAEHLGFEQCIMHPQLSGLEKQTEHIITMILAAQVGDVVFARSKADCEARLA